MYVCVFSGCQDGVDFGPTKTTGSFKDGHLCLLFASGLEFLRGAGSSGTLEADSMSMAPQG